jgi:predicted nucleotidyltransferase
MRRIIEAIGHLAKNLAEANAWDREQLAHLALGDIARRYGITLVLQFGSSVTGKTHARSDIDLAIQREGAPLSFREHAELVHELQALFPNHEVDLALLNRADPLFLKKITEACRLLYGDPRDLQRLKIYAFKRYQDHRRYLDLERRFVAKAVGVGRVP